MPWFDYRGAGIPDCRLAALVKGVAPAAGPDETEEDDGVGGGRFPLAACDGVVARRHKHRERQRASTPAGIDAQAEQDRRGELGGRGGEGEGHGLGETEQDDFRKQIPVRPGAEVRPGSSNFLRAMEPRHTDAEPQPEQK